MTASAAGDAPGPEAGVEGAAGSGAEQAKERTHRAAERSREAVGDLGAEARAGAGRIMDDAGARVRSTLDRQKRSAADEIAEVAHAIRTGAGDLETHGRRAMAGHVDSAAAGLERVADNLREEDFGALLGQVEDFARRQPGLFLGGLFATGFALARFVKSSAERHEAEAAPSARVEPAMPPASRTTPYGPGGPYRDPRAGHVTPAGEGEPHVDS